MDDATEYQLFGSTVAVSRPLGGEATYLQLADGRAFVLKGVPRQERPRWRPGRPWAELVVLDLFGSAGGPVPRLVAADLAAGWLLRTFEPGRPLSDLAVAARDDAGLGGAVFSDLVEGLRDLEQRFASAAGDLQPYLAADAPALWHAWSDAAARLLRPEGQQAWQELARAVLQPAAATLGPLDVHAGNAVWQPGGVRFLDFATVGPDYPERRLAAYAQTVGPQPGSLLTPEAYAAYAGRCGRDAALRLALFDLLFWAVALSRLRAAMQQPGGPAAEALRRAWPDPEALWPAALAMWRRRRLDDPRLEAITGALTLAV